MNVQVVIDSAADLPKKYYEELALEVVPLAVHLNGEEFIDNVTIDPKTIYDAMREGAAPKTSQVTPEAFYEVFKNTQRKKYLSFISASPLDYLVHIKVQSSQSNRLTKNSQIMRFI